MAWDALKSPPISIAILLIGALLIGCENTTVVKVPEGEDPIFIPRYVDIEPNLPNIEDSLFTTTCTFSMCHNSTISAAGLNLSRGESFNDLVNVPSSQDSEILRVFPGKPDSSYLVWKLEGHPSMKGDLMPICASNVQCLDSRVIEVIREWISLGAPND